MKSAHRFLLQAVQQFGHIVVSTADLATTSALLGDSLSVAPDLIDSLTVLTATLASFTSDSNGIDQRLEIPQRGPRRSLVRLPGVASKRCYPQLLSADASMSPSNVPRRRTSREAPAFSEHASSLASSRKRQRNISRLSIVTRQVTSPDIQGRPQLASTASEHNFARNVIRQIRDLILANEACRTSQGVDVGGECRAQS